MPPKIRLDAKPHLSDDDRDREAESNRLALLSPRSSTERLFVTGRPVCHPILILCSGAMQWLELTPYVYCTLFLSDTPDCTGYYCLVEIEHQQIRTASIPSRDGLVEWMSNLNL